MYKFVGGEWYGVNFYFDQEQMKAVQLRMARAALRWGVRELAERAGVTANTVTRIENGSDAKQSTMNALQRALEDGGVEFTNGERPGVRISGAPSASVGVSASRPKSEPDPNKSKKHIVKKV
jgi:transcriptional regulator with XRE-family HTH domain